MQSEIDSFIFKFRNLVHSGRNANLTLESKAGKVSVKLDVDLGCLPVPPQYHRQPPPQFHRTRNGASYQRRRQNRADARAKAAEEAVQDVSVEEAEVLDLAKAAEEASMHARIAGKESAEKAPVDTFEELSDEVCPDIEYQANVKASEDTTESEVDDAEVARDRITKKVIICPVTDPNEKKDVVENEIAEKFEAIGVKVLNMKTRSTNRGEFKASIVEISPVNLNRIWGRRLGLKNCSIISYDA